MEPVLTVAEMRAVDEAAQRAVPVATLVERAGTAVATAALDMLGPSGAYGRHLAVVAGGGNNGNDGRVAARLLSRRGALVRLLDAKEAHGRIDGADLVIDAAYGTGYRGEYTAPDPGGAPVLAVDVPTGVNADLGTAVAGAVRAERTVTFGAFKPGLLLNDGPGRCGRTVVRPIGLPVEGAGATMHLVGEEDLVAWLPERARDGHKWSIALMVVAGSPGMYGAASYVALGAGRSGAGMVRLGVPGAEPASLPAGAAVAKSLPAEGFEADVLEEIGRFRALVIGPGLGTAPAMAEGVRRLVAGSSVPTVVDADGLTALGTADAAAAVIGHDRSAPVVLTPHEGEFARLAGGPPGEDRVAATRSLAARTGATVLLKGSTTVVAAPDGRVLLEAAGSPRLATAGTGDVLSGVIGAFLARGLGALEAAALAAYAHALAALRGHAEGLLAGDLPELLADVLSEAALVREGSSRPPAGAPWPKG